MTPWSELGFPHEVGKRGKGGGGGEVWGRRSQWVTRSVQTLPKFQVGQGSMQKEFANLSLKKLLE